MFIESICNQQSVILENIRAVKLLSPDYANTDPEEAAADFIKRIAIYERECARWMRVPPGALSPLTSSIACAPPPPPKKP